jgi:hypothetical protein
MISPSDAINGKEYILYQDRYKDDKFVSYFKGTFKGRNFSKKLIFIDVIEKRRDANESVTHNHDVVLFNCDDFYVLHDIEKVKDNGKNAIQNMEKRALDQVLKRLINEHFEW